MNESDKVAKQATALAKKIDLFTALNTNDSGEWVTSKAAKQAVSMERELAKLDSKLNSLCRDGE